MQRIFFHSARDRIFLFFFFCFSLENFLCNGRSFKNYTRGLRERERGGWRNRQWILREDSSLVILVKGLNPKLIRKAKAFVCRGESWKFAYLPCNYPFSWIIYIRQLEDNTVITLIWRAKRVETLKISRKSIEPSEFPSFFKPVL